MVAGQRSGYYLCFFGMHVLTPTVMSLLAELVGASSTVVTLSEALRRLVQREKYLAFQVAGQRYNIGEKYGLLVAQMALALSGPDRDRILVEMLELLARPRQ